ncbi:Remorin family protein [Raphanus sativus]|uniref:Remorin 1.4-like isoform X2 n=1 Tax=Raphanus sativus TaxID=3726 RepID=A0A6J0KNF1_RAPSA|nr:remorin 1.4-like isoform X2 [Raphanus sativus]KAJ4879295.1 Remorin family protein [Raphanus sativus]
MDSLIKQTRRRHPSAQAKTDEVGSPTREEKVPPRKSVSFKEDKKKPSNWLEKQFSRQMSDQSYDLIIDMDYAAAVAAAAYAITTFETTWLESYYSGREDAFPLEETRSLSRRFSGQLSFKEPEVNDNKLPTLKSPVRKSSSVKKTPTFSMYLKEDHTRESEDSGEKHERPRKPVSEPPAPMQIQPPVRTRSERRAPPPPPPPPPPPLLSPSPLRLPPRETKRPSSGGTSREHDSTADAWEKAELAKVKARYEKLNRKIDLWEAKKRDKARRKLDKSEQSEQEQRRKRGLQRFREDMEYIENIASGARAQAEKQRQDEELKVKERAGVVRKTGKIPGKACACF